VNSGIRQQPRPSTYYEHQEAVDPIKYDITLNDLIGFRLFHRGNESNDAGRRFPSILDLSNCLSRYLKPGTNDCEYYRCVGHQLLAMCCCNKDIAFGIPVPAATPNVSSKTASRKPQSEKSTESQMQ
jgi:hypothetical protein